MTYGLPTVIDPALSRLLREVIEEVRYERNASSNTTHDWWILLGHDRPGLRHKLNLLAERISPNVVLLVGVCPCVCHRSALQHEGVFCPCEREPE